MRVRLLLPLLAPILLAPDCDQDGYEKAEDCADRNPNVHPNAIETCDGVDQDCDGRVDEGIIGTFGPNQKSVYIDKDGDGFGSEATEYWVCDLTTGEPPDGYSFQGGDCFDDGPEAILGELSPKVHPGAAANEPTLCTLDEDGDGYGPVEYPRAEGAFELGTDCDDTRDVTYPGAAELCEQGETPVDDDCDGKVDEGVGQLAYADADGDGYGTGDPLSLCNGAAADGLATRDGDCDDTDAGINPGIDCETTEDLNCDGQVSTFGGCPSTCVGRGFDPEEPTRISVSATSGSGELVAIDVVCYGDYLAIEGAAVAALREDLDFEVTYNNGVGTDLSLFDEGVTQDGLTITLDTARSYTNNGRSMCMEVRWQLPKEWTFTDVYGSWDAKSHGGHEACDDDFTRLDSWAPQFENSDYGKGQVRFGVEDRLDPTSRVTLKDSNTWGKNFSSETFEMTLGDVALDADTVYDSLVWEYCDDGIYNSNTGVRERLELFNLDIRIKTEN